MKEEEHNLFNGISLTESFDIPDVGTIPDVVEEVEKPAKSKPDKQEDEFDGFMKAWVKYEIKTNPTEENQPESAPDNPIGIALITNNCNSRKFGTQIISILNKNGVYELKDAFMPLPVQSNNPYQDNLGHIFSEECNKKSNS